MTIRPVNRSKGRDEQVGSAAIAAPGNTRIGEIKSVEMLGHDGAIQWEHHPDGLRVTFPEEKPCDFAYGLKIRHSKK